MRKYSDYIKLLSTFTFIILTALGTLWYAGECDKDDFRDKIAFCQSEIQHQVVHHEERINAVEKWLELNSDMPKVMVKIETNTAYMGQRINEIYQEIREIRKK